MRAYFIGWQEHEGRKLFPLFNITDSRTEFNGSTVGINRLAELGYSVEEIRWS